MSAAPMDVRALGAEAKARHDRTCRNHERCRAARSYLSGEWDVIVREHPELADRKAEFLEAGGAR